VTLKQRGHKLGGGSIPPTSTINFIAGVIGIDRYESEVESPGESSVNAMTKLNANKNFAPEVIALAA